MSYTVTLYCNDPKIGRTTVAIPDNAGAYNYYYYYYDPSEPSKENKIINLSEGWKGTFSADSLSLGYSFYRWVYRIGSIAGTLRYNYNAEFNYTSGDNIYIRAESYVKPWTWSDTNGTATAAQVKAAKNAVYNNGAVSDFSYLVWNDLVTKVYVAYDFMDGLDWAGSQYGSYYNTKMTSTDKTLAARRFNALRYNLDRICNELALSTTGIGTVVKGGAVKGEYFYTITDVLNACIRSLQPDKDL